LIHDLTTSHLQKHHTAITLIAGDIVDAVRLQNAKIGRANAPDIWPKCHPSITPSITPVSPPVSPQYHPSNMEV
jgi:hypothetical protein